MRAQQWTMLACDPATAPKAGLGPGRHDATIAGRRLTLNPGHRRFVAKDDAGR